MLAAVAGRSKSASASLGPRCVQKVMLRFIHARRAIHWRRLPTNLRQDRLDRSM